MFATPDAHDTGGTVEPPGRLRLERLVDPRLPPGIRCLYCLRAQGGGDRGRDFRRLQRGQLEVHDSQIIELAASHPFEGFGPTLRRSPLRVMPTPERVTETLPQCGT